MASWYASVRVAAMEKFTTTVSGGPRWAASGRSGSPDAAAVWRSSNTTVGATRSVNRPSKSPEPTNPSLLPSYTK